MLAMFWLLIILVIVAVSYIMTRPLRREVTAIKSLCEMLSKAVRQQMDKEED